MQMIILKNIKASIQKVISLIDKLGRMFFDVVTNKIT